MTTSTTRPQYTIELLSTAANMTCSRTDQKTVVDQATGTFRIRVTGRPYPTSTLRRSIDVTFRRDSFLSFVYFTDYETGDWQANANPSTRTTLQNNCADRVRSARTNSACAANEISFHDGDAINGPMHTNDQSVYVCGSVSFGRKTTIDGKAMSPLTDTIEVRGPLSGHLANPGASGCSDATKINTASGTFTPNAKYIGIPQSNQKIADVAANGGIFYKGKTFIRLQGTTMDVTNYTAGRSRRRPRSRCPTTA